MGKGLFSLWLGLLAAYVGTGEDFYPRLSMGSQTSAQGLPIAAVVLGVLILGEVFKSIEDQWREKQNRGAIAVTIQSGDQKLHWADIRRLLPYISRSTVIGTAIGALPGIGSTLAATLGYTAGRA